MEENNETPKRPPVEQDYAAHETNPGPSKEAVTEKDDRSVGVVLKWLIPIVVLLLAVAWFFLGGE